MYLTVPHETVKRYEWFRLSNTLSLRYLFAAKPSYSVVTAFSRSSGVR